MSASLVGSEMCIRDRPFRESLRQLLLTGPPLLLMGPTLMTLAVDWPWLCLLYTSDAADDM
eukprot:8864124-Alexandrium_andersonii.AAC.1